MRIPWSKSGPLVITHPIAPKIARVRSRPTAEQASQKRTGFRASIKIPPPFSNLSKNLHTLKADHIVDSNEMITIPRNPTIWSLVNQDARYLIKQYATISEYLRRRMAKSGVPD